MNVESLFANNKKREERETSLYMSLFSVFKRVKNPIIFLDNFFFLSHNKLSAEALTGLQNSQSNEKENKAAARADSCRAFRTEWTFLN